ncbi:MAG: ribosome maturation factor RimP [Acidimicrobiaceae bacterium]|nr:ribosome maturation factor RimP [Acidimicrobiaceae bacterium]
MAERDIKGMNTSGLSHADLLLVESGINSAITELGLSVLEIRYSSGTLRVTLDADPTPDLEIITEASRMISGLLDSELAEQVAELRQKYELEVSSPGLERPLFNSEHFRRFAGRLIEVKSRDANGSRSRIQGVIVSSDNFGVELIIEGSKDKRRFDFKSIDSAKTVFVWPEEKKTNSKPKKAAKKAANDSREKGVAISPAANLDDGFDDEADDDLLSAEDQAFGVDSGSLSLDDDDLEDDNEDEPESGDEFAKLVRIDGQDRHFDDEDLADLEDEVLRRQKELEGNDDVPKGPFG